MRILFLHFVLVSIVLIGRRAYTRLISWENTIHVAIYPIAGDASPVTADYLRSLSPDSFADIAEWMQQQTSQQGLGILQPIALHVAPTLADSPPLPPRQASALEAMLWSLKLRWWASQHDRIDAPKPHIRLFVLFHDPAVSSSVPHSTGLSKGQIGIIHAYATRQQRRQNAVVIAHEMLHTFGTTDKYDLATSLTIHPQGYAEADRHLRCPQTMAEIMGGRTPIDERTAEIPASLADTLIGRETAEEIGLRRSTEKKGQN